MPATAPKPDRRSQVVTAAERIAAGSEMLHVTAVTSGSRTAPSKGQRMPRKGRVLLGLAD
jgi:hypothetical protein